jgi:hypothetical protein
MVMGSRDLQVRTLFRVRVCGGFNLHRPLSGEDLKFYYKLL